MLSFVSISNLALIEKTSFDFSSGLTVLTGETGAGKSVVLEAINYLLGERANAGSIRAGAQQAAVEGSFDVSGCRGARDWLSNNGFATDDTAELVVRRDLFAKGRSRVWINGRLATLGQLAEVGGHLCISQQQHQAIGLLTGTGQEELFDEFAGCLPEKENVRKAYDEVQQTRKLIEEERTQNVSWRQRLEFVQFQIRELEEVELEEGEFERLRNDRGRIQNGEALQSGVSRAASLLSDSDQESATDLLGSAEKILTDVIPFDQCLEPLLAEVANLAANVSDLGRQLSQYAHAVEFDPEQLADIDDRITELKKLERKHGVSADELAHRLGQLQAEAQQLEAHESNLETLAASLANLEKSLFAAAKKLSAKREKAKRRFESDLQRILKSLCMEGARVRVEFSKTNSNDPSVESGIGPNGAEAVRILFSANKGEELSPLSSVASGGECSRVLLALLAMNASERSAPILIFDEIDSGLSGEAALKVADTLDQLSAHHQILCVTHQPTIAARADSHLFVSKKTNKLRTITEVSPLAGEDRRNELARLLDGASSEKSFDLAEELLAAVS